MARGMQQTTHAPRLAQVSTEHPRSGEDTRPATRTSAAEGVDHILGVRHRQPTALKLDT
jgi:hypothetical protein